MVEKVPAIALQHASKYYKVGVPVLQNMNMKVEEGEIYSLLGSSGCGKTTALACIVGVKKVNSGEIYIFGAQPGRNAKALGYMPQEASLYNDFSIQETLNYFGTLCGLNNYEVKEKAKFLKKLLHLPDISQRVGTLSGGERRRVSFSTALVANPKLLVLDEPTVGVDPLLRETIWKYLVYLSKDCGTTVLITTHYIDEAKDSDCVGVMRHGHLLVEENPTRLLRQFNTNSLEAVVLQLCQEEKPKHNFSLGINAIHAVANEYEVVNTREEIASSLMRIKSLIYKNVVVLFRNFLLFLVSVILPALIILVMCVAFQDDPNDLNFGVVNYDVPNENFCVNLKSNAKPPGECDVENLSCKFINSIPPGSFKLMNYANEEKAADAIHKGTSWGYMIFPKGYSNNFYERASSGSSFDDEVGNKSEIIVRMDQTSKNIAGTVKKSLYDGFEIYAKSILKDCGLDERQAEFALKYEDAVLGSEDTKFIEFIAPSVSVAWLFFFPIIASSIRHINEKKQGTFERSLVSGAKNWEILFAYAITECLVLVLQSLCVYLILTVVIGVEVVGSSALVLVLEVLSGFGGVAMGFLIGALCNEEIEAALMAMALFFPNCFVSGVFWPVEGMPLILQYIAYVLPCTLTCEAMRSIFARGNEFTHPNVWPGYLSLISWIVFFFVLTIVITKTKK